MKKSVVIVHLVIACIVLLATSAPAQVGSGWTRYYPSKTIQRVGSGAYYSNVNGVETFRIAPGDERSEARMQNNYTSGQRQFQGEVRHRATYVSDGTSTTVHQIFGGTSSATSLMLRVYHPDNGTLRRYGSTILATGVWGQWLRINTTHNVGTHTIEIYINGSRKWSGADGGTPTAGHYHKYGVYGGSAGRPQSEYRNVSFWRK